MLEIWNKLCKPPASALKSITAGRLKGKTDINPQWRIKAMTEVFGPCGSGWKYEITRLWAEPGPDGQVFAFATINLFTNNGAWSAAIPGTGGSMMVAKESGGLHANDEAYKMAITDALSVAMKQLGVAAAIYEGLWDGSKYKDPPKEKITPTAGSMEVMTEEQKAKLESLAKEMISRCEEGNPAGALEEFALRQLDTDEQVALKTLLPSNIRSLLRKEMEKNNGQSK